MPKAKPYNHDEIERRWQALATEVETELRRRARAILKANKDLVSFTKAMGSTFFSTKTGILDVGEDPRFQPVDELIGLWDDRLGLTGDPVTFTTDGPERYEW